MPPKLKVAVLGSGQSALTAAFQLTHPQNPKRNLYDVTVYQMGWRLGGKGAAGRNTDPHGLYRIEEHGLHNWFGFYDNSFRQIKDCYAELNRPSDTPLASWDKAFIPSNMAVFTEEIDGKPEFWVIENPPNSQEPGTGGLLLPLWEYVYMALETFWKYFQEAFDDPSSSLAPLPSSAHTLLNVLAAVGLEVNRASLNAGAQLLLTATRAVGLLRRAAGDPSEADTLERLIQAVRAVTPDVVDRAAESIIQWIVERLLRCLMSWLWDWVRPQAMTNPTARRLWILANFGYGCIIGAFRDDLFLRGFDAINDHNFRPWLAQYIFPDDDLLMDSPLMRAAYDSSFAYLHGDTRIPPGGKYPKGESYEAGTFLRGLIRAAFTYKGAFGYRFAAGTADTCYAPMYQVLKARGVKFKLFHRVQSITACDDPGQPISEIKIARQVDISAAQQAAGGYDPLIDVKGLPCWPQTPLYDQLDPAQAQYLKDHDINLECPPADFPDAGQEILTRGQDFDLVILGISIAALPHICPDLISRSVHWQAMTTRIKTVRTQALQLWSKPPASGLGWPIMGGPIASWGYNSTNELNVWGDLTELLPVEGWTVENWPQNIAYFTSTMPDDDVENGDDANGPIPLCPDCEAQSDKVRAFAVTMVETGLPTLWPNFTWDSLVDARPGVHVGSERIDSQFFRANVTPTERYVLSVPGSSRFRLQAHNPDEFVNLFLAGDWTWCNLNSGCMEAATMSGMLCSLALSGFPKRRQIIGVDF
jgi:uncharacterized protein with NAD-binding domain and iron-sulfur cluster